MNTLSVVKSLMRCFPHSFMNDIGECELHTTKVICGSP